MTPERQIKDKIKKVLKAQRDLYYEMPVPSGYGRSGLDFHGCIRGHYFAIEAKATGKEPTPLQRATIAAIERAGGMVFVIDDERDVRMLDAWLTQRGIA